MSKKARRFLDRLHEGLSKRTGYAAEEHLEETKQIEEEVLRTYTEGLPDDTTVSLRKGWTRFRAQVANKPISKYEDPMTITVLSNTAGKLEDTARRHGFRVPRRPLLGTLPTGQINAMTVLVPGAREHIILFESQLFMFIHLTAKAIAEVVPYTEHENGAVQFHATPKDVAQYITFLPENARRFGEVIRAYLGTGQPGFAPQYIQERIPTGLAIALTRSAEMFAIGHEYGHILRGHLGERSPALHLGEPDMGGTDVEEISYSHRQEFEADREGLQLMLPSQQELYGLPTSYAGVDLYFTMMDVFERAKHVLQYGKEPTSAELVQRHKGGAGGTGSTHPAPAARRDLLRYTIMKSLKANDDRVNSTLELAGNLQAIVELLWQGVRKGLLSAHRAGVRPASTWKKD